jgi:hypothetical protein
VQTVRVVILGVVAWALVASGAALVGAGLLPRLLAACRRRLRMRTDRRLDESRLLRLYLYLWLLAVAVWITVFGLFLLPPR